MSERTSPPQPLPGHGVIINGPGPQQWFERYELVVVLALAALPLAVAAVWWLARRRRAAGRSARAARRTSSAEVGLLWGTVPWVWLTLLPASSGRERGSVSLVPLRDLATMPTYQVAGNLLVLAAVGALAPVRWASLASVWRVVLLAAACSLAIETAQYALALGRVSSVDDVLLNTAGAGLAALTSRRWWSGARRHRAAGCTPPVMVEP